MSHGPGHNGIRYVSIDSMVLIMIQHFKILRRIGLTYDYTFQSQTVDDQRLTFPECRGVREGRTAERKEGIFLEQRSWDNSEELL